MLPNIEHDRLTSEIAVLRRKAEKAELADEERTQSTEQMLRGLLAEVSELERQAWIVEEMIEASSEAVIIVDPEWTILYRNANANRIMLPGGQIRGHNLWNILPTLEGTNFSKHCRQCMEGRTSVMFEEFFVPWQTWFSFSMTPLGEGIGIFFRDTSEQRRRDAVLQKVEKLAAVGRLASSISHEINNPLESVVNLLYLIERSEGASEEIKEYAAQASNELARVSHIVTQSLKFHRQSTRATDVRISQVLDSVASLFRGRMMTQTIEVHRRYAKDDSMVCFAGDIHQVFANLISNALDALKGSGHLGLRTRMSQDWQTGQAGLRVTVADNGCGMSEETQTNIFEPFFTTKEATGTGLGLWVSEEIIRNHKGIVKVRSCEHTGRCGTVFSIFFPSPGVGEVG